jgi:Uma2 family endonuclease
LEILEKISLSAKQIETIENGGLVRIEASWDEFMDFIQGTQYKAEFINGNIIIMGLAAAIHEFLISYFSYLFVNHYNFNEKNVYGSNLGVKTADQKGFFNPDITVVKGKLEYYNKSSAIILNPYLVIEILSEATYAYDMNEKLFKYQSMTSMHEVVFVDRFEKRIFKFRKTENPKVWTQTIYDNENPEILLDTLPISLNEIFDKIALIEEN